MTRPTTKWLLLLLLVVILFYWKIAFTSQFSVLTEYEGANQSYAWAHHTVASLKHGSLPLWDPYARGGVSFIGEMQTGLFYPLNAVLALVPFNRAGVLSPRGFELFFVLLHFVIACAMFALARDLGLSHYAALVAGACFGLGGMVGRVGWPDMLDSAAWLPVIVLFLLRAINARRPLPGLLYAGLAGLALGLAILGGRLHIAIMDALVAVSAAAFLVHYADAKADEFRACRNPWLWAGVIVAMVAVVAFAAAALQLLPSLEYSQRAIRYLSDVLMLPAQRKIPYVNLSDGFWPRSVAALLFGFPFSGAVGGGENYGPYFGVVPLLLAIIGAWKNWRHPLVRYLAALAVLAFFYTLGSFSFLHGLLYSITPFLWMAREAARFIYLANFAMALLAGFGAQALFWGQADRASLAPLLRVFKWVVIVCLAGLSVPALFTKPEMSEWVALSVLFILSAYGLLLYILAGNRNRLARFLVVALILCDLSAFNWTLRDKIEVEKTGKNHLKVLLNCGGVAQFLKSQPGLFRAQVLAEWQPNIGDLYGIQTIGGMGATLPSDYERFLNAVPHSVDLLNVRYFVKPKAAPEPGAVYEDDGWKVYHNPNCYPRAWVVHETAVDPSPDRLRARLGEPGFQGRRTALLAAPLPVPLDPAATVAPGSHEIVFTFYGAHRLELTVRAEKRGLLVLSEVDYPGWRATLNGSRVPIYKADGLFRAIVVPPGESRVVFRYRPGTVLAGSILSFLAFFGVLLAAFVHRR
jgi:hypothetical protein